MNIFPRLTRLSTRALLGLSLLYNLPFALLQIHQGAFDTYIHLFLADHYRRAWFDLWEPRWYLGFSVASYPPLVHQLIALLSLPLEAVIRWFSPLAEAYPGARLWSAEEAAYLVVLLAVLAAYPLVLRSFARLFVGPRAAGLAGLMTVVLPGLSLVVWSFGQLPSVMATGVVLLAMTRGHRYLLHGRRRHLLQAVALAAVAGASHHGVFLLVPFAGAAFVAQALRSAFGRARGGVGGRGSQRAGEPGRGGAGEHELAGVPAPDSRATPIFSVVPRLPSVVRRLPSVVGRPSSVILHPSSVVRRPSSVVFSLRLLAWASLSALAVAAVLWPLLAWSRGQSMQVPIDHLSRHNFLYDFKATLFFFWPIYGPLLVVLPWVVWGALRVRRLRLLAPAALALVLLVMGLGGTTPLPRLLYGDGWAWLTYERFGFWAAVALVPLAAAALVLVARREPMLAGLFLGAMLIASILGAGLSRISHSQPPVADIGAIARFLNEPAQRPYRYFTLGLGDQLARLSAIALNGTPDGTYHTARGLPELRDSGLGSIDAVTWSHQASDAGRFLAAAERYGARWAFSQHPHYPAVLAAAGWQYRFNIGEVEAWEKPGVRPVVSAPPPGHNRSLAAWWWGLCPLAVLALASLTLAVEHWRGAGRAALARPKLQSLAGRLRLGAWALTVALTTLWWFHLFYTGTTPWVYFVYQSVLVFACDLLAALTVLLWLAERALRGQAPRRGPRAICLGGLGLCVAAALSLQASVEVPLTLALVGHLLLLAAWYLMLVNDPPTLRLASLVLVAVLGTQAGLAVLQAVTQTTAWLAGLNLPWPGSLVAATPGASVVQTAGGGRWMRAYGTLSHPNILGGYLVIGLGAALERYRATRRRGWLGVGWLILAGLLLSFSRSAWVAAGVMLAVAGAFWLLHRPSPRDRARARRWVAAGLGALTLLSLPVLPMLLARTNLGGAPLRLEQRSMDDRSLLNRAAVEMLLDRPLAGVGGGAFVVRLYQVTQGSLPLEPAHNLPLLLAAELGWPGSVAMGVLAAGAAWRLWRRRLASQRSGLAQAELLMGAVLAGLLTIGLFDHYWWTMPPARLALVTVLGLWVGWGEAGEATWPESRARADSALFAKRSAAPPLG